jgi:hypothetical protein
LPGQPKTIADEFLAAITAARKRTQILIRVQVALTVLCWAALIAAFAIKFFGSRPDLVIPLALFGAMCGLGSWIAGRIAKPIYAKAEEIRKASERALAAIEEHSKNSEPLKIPLTIGFANLSGADLNDIASEDAQALSALFARSSVVANHKIPSAEILFVYAHLNEDGTIKGPTQSGIRQVVQLTNAAIVILASPNSAESIKNAAALPGPKTANIVFTLDRSGNGFARFFRELFENMRSGKDMLTAWVELAPQHPSANLTYAPQTILVAEGGKIAFPH